MENKIGIDELTKVVDVLAGLGNVVGQVEKDGKIDGEDFNQLIPLGVIVGAALKISPSEGVKQAGDLDDVERAALIARFNEKFDIPQDQLESVIEQALGLTSEGYGFVTKVLAFVKTLQTKPAPTA